MLWADAKKCIPAACLKYLVICIANALLATGWLTVSILSLLGELLPAVLEPPPTLPKLPSRRSSRNEDESKRVVSQKRVRSRSGSVARPVLTKSVLGQTIIEQVSPPERSADAHHVKFADAAKRLGRSPPATPPPTGEVYFTSPEQLAIDPPDDVPSMVPEAIPSAPSTSTSHSGSSSLEAVPSSASARGRRLSFMRKRFAEKHQPLAVPLTKSQGNSPERPDQNGVKSCLKKITSVASNSPPTPKTRAGSVPRTDPYQAPYFFPTPLSPEAPGYVTRVRKERTLSYNRPFSSQSPSPPSRETTLDSSSSPPNHIESVLEDAEGDAPISVEAVLTEVSDDRKDSDREWPVTIAHHTHTGLRRPTSWGSEALTIASDSNESTNPPPSLPSRRKRDSIWRRSTGGQPSVPLAPLTSVDDVQAHESEPQESRQSKIQRKRTWRLPLRHRRRGSSSTSDELPTPRNGMELGRPKLRRTE